MLMRDKKLILRMTCILVVGGWNLFHDSTHVTPLLRPLAQRVFRGLGTWRSWEVEIRRGGIKLRDIRLRGIKLLGLVRVAFSVLVQAAFSDLVRATAIVVAVGFTGVISSAGGALHREGFHLTGDESRLRRYGGFARLFLAARDGMERSRGGEL